MRTGALVCLAIVVMTVVACSDDDTPTCPDGTDKWVRHELFMGRNSQSVEVVDDAAWVSFLEDTVTPRFPDGLAQKERSKLLVVLAPPGDGSATGINEISDEYKRRFNQEAVLQVVTDACVSF